MRQGNKEGNGREELSEQDARMGKTPESEYYINYVVGVASTIRTVTD